MPYSESRVCSCSCRTHIGRARNAVARARRSSAYVRPCRRCSRPTDSSDTHCRDSPSRSRSSFTDRAATRLRQFSAAVLVPGWQVWHRVRPVHRPLRVARPSDVAAARCHRMRACSCRTHIGRARNAVARARRSSAYVRPCRRAHARLAALTMHCRDSPSRSRSSFHRSRSCSLGSSMPSCSSPGWQV